MAKPTSSQPNPGSGFPSPSGGVGGSGNGGGTAPPAPPGAPDPNSPQGWFGKHLASFLSKVTVGVDPKTISDAVQQGVTAAINAQNGVPPGGSTASNGSPGPQPSPGGGGAPARSPNYGPRPIPEVNVGGLSGFQGHINAALGQFVPRISQRGNQWYQIDQYGNPTPISAAQAHQLKSRGKAVSAAQSVTSHLFGGNTVGAAANAVKGAAQLGASFAPGLATFMESPAGLAVESAIAAAAAVPEFLTSQRAANAKYQSMMGGTNFGAMGSRLSSWGFGLSNLGVLSENQSAQIYQGVTSTGITGNLRNNAAQTVARLYENLGMSITQSLQAVQIAADSGNKSLTNLASALTNVTNAASQAGVNTETARQSFIQNYAQVVSSGVVGTQAPILAQAATQVTLSGGTLMNGVNYGSFMANPTTQIAAASMSGQSLDTFVANANSPSGAGRTGAAYSGLELNIVEQAMGPFWGSVIMPIAQKYAKQAAQNQSGLQSVLQTMADEALSKMGQQGSSNIYALQSYYASMGLNMTLMQTMIRVMQVALSTISSYQGDITNAIKAKQIQGATHAAIKGNLGHGNTAASLFDSSAMGTVMGGRTAVNAGHMYFNSLPMHLKSQIKSDFQSIGMMPGQTPHNQYQATYIKDVLNKNQQDPILAALVKNPDARNGLYNVNVNGKQHVVDLKTLIEHFREQVQSGQVTQAAGKYAGQTVSDITGLAGNNQHVVSHISAKELHSLQKSGAFKTHHDVTKMNKQYQTRNGGTVIIKPSQSLQQFFQFAATGNVQVMNTPSPGNVPGAARSGINQGS